MENGNSTAELPVERQEAADFTIKQYVANYHSVAAECDELRRENRELKTQLQLSKVTCEAQMMQLAEKDSIVATAMLTTTQAIADRIKYEALFIGIKAQLNAFAVPAAPLIKEANEDDLGSVRADVD